jgi:hypothetical protein
MEVCAYFLAGAGPRVARSGLGEHGRGIAGRGSVGAGEGRSHGASGRDPGVPILAPLVPRRWSLVLGIRRTGSEADAARPADAVREAHWIR